LKISSLESFSPRLQTLRTKRGELHVENTRDKAQCAIIRQRMAEAPDPGNAHERRVAQILGDKPVAVELSDGDQLHAKQREIEDRNAAISILDSEIQKEERLASNALIESVMPEIKRRGTAFAKSCADMHGADLAFDEYLDELEGAGANVGQFRIRLNGMGSPRDLSGSYAFGLNEFIDAGYFFKSNMPKVLR
jgi:hypothetical protein